MAERLLSTAGGRAHRRCHRLIQDISKAINMVCAQYVWFGGVCGGADAPRHEDLSISEIMERGERRGQRFRGENDV